MKFVIAEKLHEKYLEDVVMEVSKDSGWKSKLVKGQYNEQFLITFKELEELPCKLWTTFSKYGLEYYVSKVDSCTEQDEDGSIILKFEAKNFPELVKYDLIQIL